MLYYIIHKERTEIFILVQLYNIFHLTLRAHMIQLNIVFNEIYFSPFYTDDSSAVYDEILTSTGGGVSSSSTAAGSSSSPSGAAASGATGQAAADAPVEVYVDYEDSDPIYDYSGPSL